MSKGKINLTMNRDLIEFAKDSAGDQRTTVSEIVIRDPQFCERLMETMARIRSGKMKWHRYDEIF